MAGISTVTGEVKYVREAGGGVSVAPASTSTSTGTSTSTISDTKESTALEVKKDSTAKIEEYITGSMSVLPNSDYKPAQVYSIMGLGQLFSGKYYLKSVTHTIGQTYDVSCEVIQVAPLGDSSVTPESTRLKTLQLPTGGQ